MITQLVICWTIIVSKINFKMIAMNFNIQQLPDADPRAIQQINFTGNLEEQSTILFIIGDAQQTVLDFSEGTLKIF